MNTPPLAPKLASTRDARQWVTPEELNVAPELQGLPLGTPLRRAAAMAVDLTALALLVRLGNGWVLLGLWLAVVAAARVNLEWRRVHWAAWAGTALLLALGVTHAWRAPTSEAAPSERPDSEAVSQAAEGAASTALAAAALRIEQLEAEVAKAGEHGTGSPSKWQEVVAHWLDEVGLSYGWGLLYFATLSARWRGQTLGKRLFGLRVVELTGKPLTFLQGVKRFGGYAAGMATGGLGFAQLLWDSNRQALHDKAAHTVVIDTRQAKHAPPRPPTGP
jgi:RDD family